ncbi:MAG: hypothetical protein R3237_03940 [Nitrosopumilaceae archaeon]|nr:hypothetical protein [Nitrosopumilaceae archaeon]
MAKKLGAPIALGVVTIFAIILLTGGGNENQELIKNTFSIDAVYFENLESSDENYIEIRFEDKSKKTNAVILEVLGMEESFQRTYLNSEFVEKIEFPTTPKYGWEIHPVTFLIDHEEYGKVSLKTEIRPEGENPAPIIYGKP